MPLKLHDISAYCRGRRPSHCCYSVSILVRAALIRNETNYFLSHKCIVDTKCNNQYFFNADARDICNSTHSLLSCIGISDVATGPIRAWSFHYSS